MTIAVELKDVTYKYATAKEDIIKNVSFEVKKGEFCAIIGANGSGKTTLCNLIRGFAPHFYTGDIKGSVEIFGEAIDEEKLKMLSEKVGFVFQNPFVQISGSTETVFEEVAFGLENLGIPIDIIKERVSKTLELTGIDHLRDKNPTELSGGQKQRVALASILAMDPDVFVIDEPTSQLDPQGTEDIFEIIKVLKNQGKTIVLVEHKIELVAEYAEHIIVLDKGEVVMDGTSKEVFTNPDLLKYCVPLPCYANVGVQLKRNGIDIKEIPIKRNEAIDCFRKDNS